MTSIDLVIPSFQRPLDLDRALTAAYHQTRPFDRVIVVVRRDDDATREVAVSHGADVVLVDEPGVLAAMSAGLARATSDIVAFSDDDAEVSSSHATQLLRWFNEDPAVAGVGGRDRIFDGSTPRPTTTTTDVGRITRWGRVIGNHHRAGDVTRDVSALKGVNAAYRRGLLRFPVGLRGSGAQPHFEIAIGTELLARGYRLVFDSSLTVAHYPAPRRDEDDRMTPSDAALFDSAYNLERSLPTRLMTRRLLYVLFVGDANVPGLARLLVALVRREFSLWHRAQPSWRGTIAAWRERRIPLRYLPE